MIRITRGNGMTNIDGKDKSGEGNLSVGYIDDMYNSGDGVGFQSNFSKEENDKILVICDKIHDLLKYINDKYESIRISGSGESLDIFLGKWIRLNFLGEKFSITHPSETYISTRVKNKSFEIRDLVKQLEEIGG